MTSVDGQRWKLVLTAVSASLLTFGALTTYNALRLRQKRKDLDTQVVASVARGGTHSLHVPDNANNGDTNTHTIVTSHPRTKTHLNAQEYDESLIREQLARNYAFFGDSSMSLIRAAHVVIVGLGGVGSHTALTLARSGVSKLRLVDFDYVTLSSLNRHATAGLADVGTPKVASVKRGIGEIASWVEVDARIEIWRLEEGGAALLEGADWVVDAIDNINTKIDLLKYCHEHNIKVFSAMGAGAKCDPTRVQISDISHTTYDPLSRSVRRTLRTHNITSGIPVVYSTETPSDVKLLPLPEEEFKKGRVNELGVFDDFRVRILPVIGPLPSIFGLTIATYILCALANKPIPNPLPTKNRHKTYERLMRDLTAAEAKLKGQRGMQTKLPLSEYDIAFIYEDLHRGGRSILPPHNIPTRAVLTRWDFREALSVDNCVVMEDKDAEVHWRKCVRGREAEVGGTEAVRQTEENSRRDVEGAVEGAIDPAEVWGEEAARAVEKRRDEVKRWREWVM